MTKLLDRAIAAARVAADPQKLADLERNLRLRTSERDQARRFAELADRHKREYFDLVERMEKQRDEWREIARSSAQQYHTALAMMERTIGHERLVLKGAIEEINRMRKEGGLEPLKHKSELPGVFDPPVGEAKRYAEAMFELVRGGDPESRLQREKLGEHMDRPADSDGASLRDAAAERQAKER